MGNSWRWSLNNLDSMMHYNKQLSDNLILKQEIYPSNVMILLEVITEFVVSWTAIIRIRKCAVFTIVLIN
jgi:hypothetical protein